LIKENKVESRKRNIELISKNVSILDILESSDDMNAVAKNLAKIDAKKKQN
jgi:hypothetical protein